MVPRLSAGRDITSRTRTRGSVITLSGDKVVVVDVRVWEGCDDDDVCVCV